MINLKYSSVPMTSPYNRGRQETLEFELMAKEIRFCDLDLTSFNEKTVHDIVHNGNKNEYEKLITTIKDNAKHTDWYKELLNQVRNYRRKVKNKVRVKKSQAKRKVQKKLTQSSPHLTMHSFGLNLLPNTLDLPPSSLRLWPEPQSNPAEVQREPSPLMQFCLNAKQREAYLVKHNIIVTTLRTVHLSVHHLIELGLSIIQNKNLDEFLQKKAEMIPIRIEIDKHASTILSEEENTAFMEPIIVFHNKIEEVAFDVPEKKTLITLIQNEEVRRILSVQLDITQKLLK